MNQQGFLWRRVGSQFEQLEKSAPEGFQPVVQVFLVGKAEPVVPAYVEASRSPEFGWVMLQARSERDESPQEWESDECWVHVPEGFIERVEIRFERKSKTRIGFSYNESDASAEPTLPSALVELRIA